MCPKAALDLGSGTPKVFISVWISTEVGRVTADPTDVSISKSIEINCVSFDHS